MSDIFQEVFAFLDQTVAENKSVPSLRGIRAGIGSKGSLTTISEAVRQWRAQRLVTEGDAPEEFTDKEIAEIIKTIWEQVLPKCRKLLEQERQKTKDSVAFEKLEAKKIRDEANEVFSAAEKKVEKSESLIEKLRDEVRTLEATKERLQTELDGMKARMSAAEEACRKAQAERDAALKEAAASEATAATMRKLIPMLDAKHLAKSR